MPDDHASNPRHAGPWDVSEVDGPEGRLDFGTVWIRGVDGLQVQAQVDESTGAVGMVTLTLGGASLQVQAFAAPKTAGLWDDVRGQLAASVTSQGGVIEEQPGELGVELRGRVPRQGTLQPVRFVGVDGPRWFLRGLFLGDAAAPGGSPELERVFRDIVVDRGGEAMAPGEVLVMSLPKGAEPDDPATP